MTWPQYLRAECIFSGGYVKLTRREADVLATLLAGRGRMLSRTEIYEAVWGETEVEWTAGDPRKIVEVYAYKLRKKLPGLIDSQREDSCAYLSGRTSRGGYSIPLPEDAAFEPLQSTEYSMTEAQRLAAALR